MLRYDNKWLYQFNFRTEQLLQGLNCKASFDMSRLQVDDSDKGNTFRENNMSEVRVVGDNDPVNLFGFPDDGFVVS